MKKTSFASNKIDSLESIRGLAALSVILWHYYELFSIKPQNNNTTNSYFFELLDKIQFKNAFKNGEFSVIIFFILSGFVLSYSYIKNPSQLKLIDSSIRRIPRLTIPCLFSLLICIVLYKINLWIPTNPLANNPNVSDKRLLLDREFDHSLFFFLKYCFRIFVDSNAPINRSLWTISWELSGSFFVFYTLFILFSIKNRSLFYTLLVLFFILTMNNKMACFVFGILLCDLFINIKFELPDFFYFSMASIGWILSNYFFNIFDNIPLLKFHDIKSFYPIILGCLIIYGSAKSYRLQRILQIHPFIYIGKISFSMYLLHLPVFSSFSCIFFQHLLDSKFAFPIANDITFLLSLAILFIASHFFSLYIDQGAIKLSRWIKGFFMPSTEPSKVA